MPILARNVVATSQPLAAQAGLRMLLRGGSAADAAIAAAVALTVVEPTSNGIGADAFAIVWDGQQLHGPNASGRSPLALGPERFAGMASVPQRSRDAVTVPGAVDGWVALWRRFGRLPFAELFESAIGYARDGFPVAPLTARAWAGAERAFADSPDWQREFAPGGRPPAAGETWRFRDQATTPEAIAASEGEAFYRGAIADAIVAHARRQGGLMNEADLADHASDWVGTVSTGWHGHELHETPPNGQGLAALIALGLLRHVPEFSDLSVDSAPWLHLQIEAMELALADTHRFVADAEHVAGGKRPFCTIIPAFLSQGGAPRCSFGVMGGPMQAQGHLKMVLRLVDHGQNPQAAADAPRWRVVSGREVAVESSFAAATLEGLRDLGHDLTATPPEAGFAFGGAQAIWRGEDGYVAGSDPRKDGQVAGY